MKAYHLELFLLLTLLLIRKLQAFELEFRQFNIFKQKHITNL